MLYQSFGSVILTAVLFFTSSAYDRYNCPTINSIMRLTTVWRITEKIIRTAITV